jgi:hypothetical protein
MSRHAVIANQQPAAVSSSVVSGLVQRKCGCGRPTRGGTECSQCRKKRQAALQRSAAHTDAVPAVPAVVYDVLRAPGQPLQPETRRFMEPRFGRDFSLVRVHADTTAAESAHALDAQAYTVGRHIVFASGYYSPATPPGRRLLAHELAHVIQQGFERPPATGDLAVSPSTDRFEREAEEAAARIAGGGHAPAIQVAGTAPLVQKTDDDSDDDDSGHVVAGVCGPNVTSQVKQVVADTKKAFKGLVEDQRNDSCRALISLEYGYAAWDIVELHNNKWILDYRPECATKGASPHCGSTVQVDGTCHYAGSANYVIWGVMCKLCYDHYDQGLKDQARFEPGAGAGSYASQGYTERDRDEFNESGMLSYIDLYKGSHWYNWWTESGNFDACNKWALAGYHDWATGHASSPAGDRANCSTTCPLVYGSLSNPDSPKGPFRLHWYPHFSTETVKRMERDTDDRTRARARQRISR